MSESLCISVRFLDGTFHGRGDGGEPEWPPSPLRLFQALVAAAAAHWNERGNLQRAEPALHWLETQPPPVIIGAAGARGSKYRLYVPDNVGDLVARSWRKGNEASIADYRTEKDVQPVCLDGGDAVHYVWPQVEGEGQLSKVWDVLPPTVRSITHLGWGIDMVVAEASVIADVEVEKLIGQRWRPTENGNGTALRVPVKGTLENLNRKHQAFLRRARPDSFVPVPPLSKFRIVGYVNDAVPPQIPFAAFSLLQPDARGFRPFDPVRNGMHVAGMMRHAASDPALAASLGWNKDDIDRLVLGHGEKGGGKHSPVDGPRLAFVPLPSIEGRGRGRSLVVGSIRRALVLGLRGASREDLHQLSRQLSGQTLIDEHSKQPAALFSQIPDSEKMVQNYTRCAATWATVTPMILPGYDDPKKIRRELFPPFDATSSSLTPERQHQLLTKLDRRIDHLLRKAIRQAGLSADLAEHAELDWSNSGFWPGTDLASSYATPAVLRRFRRLHVRITWRGVSGKLLPITGPICLGGGKFVGIGVFAALPAS